MNVAVKGGGEFNTGHVRPSLSGLELMFLCKKRAEESSNENH